MMHIQNMFCILSFFLMFHVFFVSVFKVPAYLFSIQFITLITLQYNIVLVIFVFSLFLH